MEQTAPLSAAGNGSIRHVMQKVKLHSCGLKNLHLTQKPLIFQKPACIESFFNNSLKEAILWII